MPTRFRTSFEVCNTMMETVFQHLTKPNAALQCVSTWTTPTVHSDWPPIENIAEWPDFTFQNLTQQYASDLRRETNFHDPVPHYMEAGLNKLYSERSLRDALCPTNTFTVTYNLPKTPVYCRWLENVGQYGYHSWLGCWE